MLKGFEFDKLQREQLKSSGFNWKMKNPLSLFALTLNKLNVLLLMKENGGSTKFVSAEELTLFDFRMHSKLKKNKKVLYRMDPDTLKISNDSKSGDFKELSKPGVLTSQGEINSSEEKKIEKLNLVKKEMFQKYFSKDDYLNSIEPWIYTQPPGGDIKSQGELTKANLQDVNSWFSNKKYKDTLLSNRGASSEKKKGFLVDFCSKVMGCCKKTRKSQAVQIDPMEGEMMTPKNVNDEEEEASKTSNSKSKEDGIKPVRRKPSERLKDKFVRWKVPWVIGGFEEIRPKSIYFKTKRPFERPDKLRDHDLFVEIDSRDDGETEMDIQLNNMTAVVVLDLLWKCLEFFKKPIAGKCRVSSHRPGEVTSQARGEIQQLPAV
jgi:hypothetical protein